MVRGVVGPRCPASPSRRRPPRRALRREEGPADGRLGLGPTAGLLCRRVVLLRAACWLRLLLHLPPQPSSTTEPTSPCDVQVLEVDPPPDIGDFDPTAHR